MDTPEHNYSASLLFNLESVPDNWKDLIEKASKIKRNCFAAVFETFFDYQERGETGNQTAIIDFRKDEKLFVRAQSDRVTVIFSTVFASEDDLIIGRVFMMAFANGKMRYSEAPQVLFNEIHPPAEIAEIPGLVPDTRRGYLTFVLLPRHTSKQNRNNTIDLISMLRNYLHYHLKCSKAYIHQRMRDKTNDFLKVLNRAKPEKQKDENIRKTIR
jgi:actin related protein 2/3 complex, subunit 2